MPREVTKGDLPLLILDVLAGGPSHGYAIARCIADQSAQALHMKEGSLYPILRTMEQEGWITGEWEIQPSGPARKVYRITADGQAQLARRRQEWEQYVNLMNTVLRRNTNAQLT